MFSLNTWAAGITTNWTGAVSSDFNLAGNWSSGVPGPNDTASITGPLANFPVVTASLAIDTLNLTNLELDINNGKTLTVNTAAAFSSAPTLGGTGRLILLGSGTLSAGTMAVNSATVDASAAGAQFRIGASATLNSAGNLAGLFLLSNTLNFNGTATQTGNLTIKTLNNVTSIGGSGNPAIALAGTVTLISQSGNNTVNLTSSLTCAGTLNLNAFFNTIVDINSGQTLTINGTLNLNDSGTNIAQVQGAGTLAIGVGGVLNSTASSPSNVTSCTTTTNAGNINALAGDTDLTGIVNSTGTMTATAAGTQFSIGAAATLNNAGNLAGLFLLSNTLNFNGAGTQVGNLTIKTMNNPVSMGGTGNPAIAAGGTVTLISQSGNNTVNLTSSLTCAGTLNLNAFFNTIVDINGGQTLTINGTLNMNASGTNNAQIQGTGALAIGALGVLNSNAATVNVISCATTTSAGNINALVGETDLTATVTSTGTLTATTGGTQFRIDTAATLNNAGNLAGTFLLGNTLNFNGNGTQTGNITIKTVNTPVSIGGTGSPAIAAGSTVTLISQSNNNTVNLTASLTCAGILNLNAFFNTIVDINLGKTFTVTGVLNMNAASNNDAQVQGAGTLVIGAGAVLNSSSAAALNVISCTTTTNAGNINALAGETDLTGTVNSTGVLTATVAGTQFSITGVLSTAGNLAGTFLLSNTLNFNGNGTQTSDITVKTMNTPVTIGGIGPIAASSTVTLVGQSGNNTIKLVSSLTCNGTLNLNAFFDCILDVNAGNTFTVNGVLNMNGSINNIARVQGSGTLAIGATGVLNSSSANNPNVISCTTTTSAGAINALVGVTSLTATVTSTGTLTATAGGTQFNIGAAATLNSGGNLAGTFQLANALNFNGNGTQTSNITINTANNVTTIGGTGIPAVAAGSTVTIVAQSGTNTVNLISSLTCAGTLNLNAFFNCILDINGGTTFTLNGTLNLNGGGNNIAQVQGTGTIAIGATGTLNSSAANLPNVISCSTTTNNGSLNALTGETDLTATVNSTGLLTATAAGTQFSITGVLNSGGNLAGAFLLYSTLNFTGNGTQTGNVAIKTMNNPVTLGGPGPTAAGSTVTFVAQSGNNTINLTSSLVCNGTLNLNAFFNCILDVNVGNTLTVNGTLNLNGASNNFAQVQGTGTLAIGATGTFNSSAANFPNIISAGLTQNGALISSAGTLNLANSPYTQTSGTTRLAGGAITVSGGTGTANINGGLLEGTGTLSANVTLAGILRPGLPIGTLIVNGTYTQTAAGTLELDVASAASFDSLSVSGTATLAGSLHVLLQNGFVPASKQMFTPVMSFASRTGDFATLNTMNPGVYFLHAFNATSMSLQAKLNPQTPGTTVTTTQPSAVSGILPGSDANGDPITFTAGNPANGAVIVSNPVTGAFTYTPAPAFFGTDSFTYQASDGVVSSTAGTITITVIPKNLPKVLTVAVDQNPTRVGFVVTFTATASDPNGLPLTLSWDFGDASPIVTGTTVTHAFASEAIFTTVVSASDGLVSSSASLPVQVFAPNSGADGVPNISDGDAPIKNPLNNLTVGIASSDGGVIELNIDTDALTRDLFSISTDFDGIGGRSSSADGPRPVAKFVAPGLYVATANASNPVSLVLIGKGRKTLIVTRAETGMPPLFKTAAKKTTVNKFTLKGSFSFPDNGAASSALKSDSVTLTGTVELPEGLDLTSNDFSIGIGNIIDTVSVNAKGKPKLPSALGRIQKLQVKLPRLAKGAKNTSAGQTATFTVTLAGTGLSAAGFDTEGITNARLSSEAKSKTLARSIQIDGLFAGAAFELLAPVQFKLSPANNAGTIGGRSSN